MTTADAVLLSRAALDAQPRIRLATLPTPLQRGPVLPGGARLWLKRDDLSGLGLGGNKVRKLEFLCAAAQNVAADMIVTVGAAQSNHCRLTAAAAAVLGLECHLFLGGPEPRPRTGNQLVGSLFGAVMHYPGTDDWSMLEAAMATRVQDWRRAGRTPFAMPIGGSTAVGACGYVNAWLELLAQVNQAGIAPTRLFHASSSAGTHAGLVAGRAATGCGPAITAVGVAKTANDLGAETLALAWECLHLLALDPQGNLEIDVDDSQVGSSYGAPTRAADEAILWSARHAGIVLDRVYTGKAFAGVLAAARAGQLDRGEDVIFVHTGGWPALFSPNGCPDTQTSAVPTRP